MLPPLLLLWISGEAGLYFFLARSVFHVTDSTAALLALAGILLARANINALTWLASRLFGSPAPALGAARWLLMLIKEYLLFLLTFLVVLPLERLWMPADRLPAGTGKTPVLLIHGYGCSRGVWWLMRRRLERAGHVVASVSLFPPAAAIGRLVPSLGQRIAEVCAATGRPQVILVAHSMGGLVARSYLARHGHAQVARLITLSTPHQGSELGRFGYGGAARDMLPGSLWLRDMADQPMGIPAISLRNPFDNYVMPQDNQRHPCMQDLELPPVGHLTELYDARVAQLLITLLNDAHD